MRLEDIKNFTDWRKYGIEQGYKMRNPASLYDSEEAIERSWYYKGKRNKWVRKFRFKRKSDKPYSYRKLEKFLQDYLDSEEEL